MTFRELRARAAINYKEPRESDITIAAPGRTKTVKSSKTNLFPIEVVDEDSTRYKVHYVGFSSKHDEWQMKSDVVDLEHGDSEEAPNHQISQHRFSLYHELATRIKTALNSSRKESPIIKIDMPFDGIEFNGGLRICGENKRCVRGVQRYTITKYQDLNGLLGANWHYRGINANGDFCYVLLNTVEFYLYRRRCMKEFAPLTNGEVKEVKRDIGDMLVFTFVRGDGTPDTFGKDKDIFS